MVGQVLLLRRLEALQDPTRRPPGPPVPGEERGAKAEAAEDWAAD